MIQTNNKPNQAKPLQDVIRNVFKELESGPKAKHQKLMGLWPKIVGEKISNRTTPRFKGKTVTVWTENSALAFELSQNYGAALLKRLQNQFGEDEVSKIWFSVGTPI